MGRSGSSDEQRFSRREATQSPPQPSAVVGRQPNYVNLLPIVYAPMLPLIRIGLRGRIPQHQIDRIFGGAVLVALSHAGYIMMNSDV